MQRGPTLAGLLKGAGYQTAAFHSNPLLSRFLHYDGGFDIFNDDLGVLSSRRFFKSPKRLIPKFKGLDEAVASVIRLLELALFLVGKQRDVTADELTSRLVSWLKTSSGSFFLWTHYMDAHYPYLPPSKYVHQLYGRRISRYRMFTLYYKRLKRLETSDFREADWLSPAEIDTLIDLYDASIRYVDESIGRLLDSLGSRLGNTIIIVTADHGEVFGEHNLLGHGALYEELVHVPLIMVGPGIKAATVVREPVKLMDLATTIADLVGINSIEGFHGRSLLPVMRGGQGMAEGMIAMALIPESEQRLISYRTPEWKYIRTESLGGTDTLLSEEVYDLSNDPQERHNLHGSESEEARAFEVGAVNKILEFKRLKSEEKTAYEKERIRAKIRKLPKLQS